MQLHHKLNGYGANHHVLRETYIMYEYNGANFRVLQHSFVGFES